MKNTESVSVKNFLKIILVSMLLFFLVDIFLFWSINNWTDSQTDIFVIFLGIFVLLIIICTIVWTTKKYSNKKFNNYKKWEIIQRGGIKFIFKSRLFNENLISLDKDEKIIGYCYFNFFPEPWYFLGEDHCWNAFCLTNMRIVLYRFKLFTTISKSIPYEDMKTLEFKKFLKMKSLEYIKITLNSGEIYQVGLDISILSPNLVSNRDKIVDFLKSRFIK